MPVPSGLPPSRLREVLEAAVSDRSANRRRALVEGLSDEFRALDSEVDRLAGAERTRPPGWVSRPAFDAAADAVAAKTKKADRQKAAEKLYHAYAALYYERDDVAGSLPGHLGGASGRVFFNDAITSSGNPKLDRLLDSEAAVRHGRRDVLTIGLPDGAQGECEPAAVVVKVAKPGPVAELRGVGLDPGFLDYLGTTEQLHLRSLPDWLDHEGHADEATDAQLRAYEEAVAVAFKAFEEDTYEKRNCQVSDLPAPGVQQGNRLLKLSIPIEEDDFRDDGCGSRIYEGPDGPPEPPTLDYDELVRRYVGHLKPKPIQYYDLLAVSEAEVLASHIRDLGQVNTELLDLFLEASKVALAHPAFVEEMRKRSPA